MIAEQKMPLKKVSVELGVGTDLLRTWLFSIQLIKIPIIESQIKSLKKRNFKKRRDYCHLKKIYRQNLHALYDFIDDYSFGKRSNFIFIPLELKFIRDTALKRVMISRPIF